MLYEEYKRINADVKPSEALISKTKERMKKEMKKKSDRHPQHRSALIAVCAVLAVCIISVPIMTHYGVIPKFSDNGVSEKVSENNQPQSDEDVNNRLPEWYTPGKLSVISIFQKNTNSDMSFQGLALNTSFLSKQGAPASLNLPEGISQIKKEPVNERYVYVSDERKDGAHAATEDKFACSGLFFDLKDQKLICLSEMAEQSIKNAGLLKTGFRFYYYLGNPANGNSIVSLISGDAAQLYACNSDGSVDKISDYYNVGSKEILSIDGKHGALVIGGCLSGGTVWIFDLSGDKVSAKRLESPNNAQNKAGIDIRFSPNGKYLIYNIFDEVKKIHYREKEAKWVAYNIESQTFASGNGEIIGYIQNGNSVIAETDFGANVIDLRTGDILSPDVLSEGQKKKLVVTEINSEKYGLGFSLTLENIFNKAEKPVVIKEFINTFSEQDGYIYTYLGGDDSVECYSIDYNEKFEVEVSEDFIRSTGGRRDIYYSMFVSVDGTKVYLFN